MTEDVNGTPLIVDADAHVVECDRTWDYLETPEKQYRPVQLASPEQDGVSLQFWLVDGKVRGLRLPAFSEEELERLQRQVGRRFAESKESGELGNVGLRLEYMDANKVDVQVLHNTMFIEKVTERPPVEVALCGSWNRWLADIWSQSDGRLRWSCLAPTLSMSDALDQIRFGKEHGACAVLMRPVEGNRLLVDPYFYPIYEEASRLDMAIAVHIGNGSAWLNDLYRHPVRLGAAFHRFRIPTVGGFADVLFSEVPELFPKLRWGFVEASAQWLPWILHEVRNRFRTMGREWPDNPMAEFRMFVTCENTDDLPYIVQETGEDGLVIGTDYGHTDTSSDVDAIKVFRKRTDLSEHVKRKILSDNACRLYGL